jgi:hypothetical protein
MGGHPPAAAGAGLAGGPGRAARGLLPPSDAGCDPLPGGGRDLLAGDAGGLSRLGPGLCLLPSLARVRAARAASGWGERRVRWATGATTPDRPLHPRSGGPHPQVSRAGGSPAAAGASPRSRRGAPAPSAPPERARRPGAAAAQAFGLASAAPAALGVSTLAILAAGRGPGPFANHDLLANMVTLQAFNGCDSQPRWCPRVPSPSGTAPAWRSSTGAANSPTGCLRCGRARKATAPAARRLEAAVRGRLNAGCPAATAATPPGSPRGRAGTPRCGAGRRAP